MEEPASNWEELALGGAVQGSTRVLQRKLQQRMKRILGRVTLWSLKVQTTASESELLHWMRYVLGGVLQWSRQVEAIVLKRKLLRQMMRFLGGVVL